MCYIYVLSGSKGLYVGLTKNLTRRLKMHLNKAKDASKRSQSRYKCGKDLQLFHWWNISNRYLAIKVEYLLHKIQKDEGDYSIYQIVNDLPADVNPLISACKNIPDSALVDSLLFRGNWNNGNY
jgi:predicted GIY-YIG superfamily endonuclease